MCRLRSAGTVLAIDAFRFGMVTPVLERWRHATKNPNAKLIFICHLMGGHIARYFLEVLGATLALHVVCHDDDGQPRCNPKLMKALGDGRYQTKFCNFSKTTRYAAQESLTAMPAAIMRLSCTPVSSTGTGIATHAGNHDFGGAAAREETTGDDGDGRASPSRCAPAGPMISRAPRA